MKKAIGVFKRPYQGGRLEGPRLGRPQFAVGEAGGARAASSASSLASS